MTGMTREQASGVKPGDLLNPIPEWNSSERIRNQLHVPTKVLSIKSSSVSQTGYMFSVKNKSGELIDLDAGWFNK